MHDSKQIKEDFGNKEHFFKELYYKTFYHIVHPISRFIERLKRSYDFAKIGYLNYDWDSAYLWELISFKLKRMKIALENGCAVQEEEDIKALDEAISICDRLFKGNHDEKYDEVHDLKWGKLEIFFKPNFHSTRANANTQEEKDQEWKERMELYEKAEQDRVNDLDRLGQILKNYSAKWWE